MYHGSNAYEEIHVFRRGKNGYLGGGIYLTDSESYARKYADKNGYKGRIYNVYADASNPLEVSTNTPAKEILRAIYGSDRVYNRRASAQSYETRLITSSDIRKLREKGYDAIVWRFGGDTEVSVFEANQIKLTSNKTPTVNNDVRYALSESDFEQVLDHVDEFKTVDEIKSYFERVHETINSELGSVRTMQELTERENRRIEKVIKAANLEKEAIKAFRKAHKTKPTIDLSTKAKIEEVDRQYTEAIAKNDLETARYLVEQMALLKGYSVTDYRIDHQAPYNNGHDASLDNVSPMFGEDIYGSHAAQYFGTFEGFDGESIQHIQAAQGKPERYVTIYRAVPALSLIHI